MSNISSLDILEKIKQAIYNLATAYETFSNDSTKEHEDIKEFDKELGDLIERLKQLEDINYTITDIELTDTISNVDSKVTELNNIITSFNNTTLTNANTKINELDTKKNEVNTVLTTIQTKLDNNDFLGDKGNKGDRGISIINVENVNNKLVITDSENNTFDLGNYTNDYELLLNKPNIMDFDDFETGSWLPYFPDIVNPTFYYRKGSFVESLEKVS